jgi:hypothetical protein
LLVRRLTLSVEATYAVTNNSFLRQAGVGGIDCRHRGSPMSLVISNNRSLHSLIGS